MTIPKRPVCRYYGGKWKMADWIISFFPKHKTYVEAFSGAASVLMKKKPARTEVYNDLADEMVNLFQVLRDQDNAAELRRLLSLTPYSRTEWLNCYELANNPIEQARRTIVLSTMSHNPSKVMRRQTNGFRTCSSGHHRLPADFRNHINCLEAVTERLQGVIIENRDAVKIMKQHDRKDTLHYVDPPYLMSERTSKGSRYQVELESSDEHYTLAEELRNLKGFVIVSGYPSREYKEMFEDYGWHVEHKKAVTGAAIKGKSTRTEGLWMNPQCAAAQRQLKIF